ncbi:MAG: hypothetical protein AMXMBFR81_05390 [Chthonomonas sp.]|nr:PilZ domain-containing protein [Fimbriimonadaceae bacterium]
MNPTATPERRDQDRYAVLEYAILRTNSEEQTTVLQDIALGGVRCATRRYYRMGERCELVVARGDGSTVALPIEIRYSANRGDRLFITGLRFIPQTASERRDVAEFVHDAFRRHYAAA